MMRRIKIASAGAALALTGVFGVLPATTAQAAPVPAVQPAATTLPVTGTTANGGSFTGSLSNLTVTAVNGVLQLTGNVVGSLIPSAGAPAVPVNQTFTTTLPLSSVGASCDILNLTLGPLDLNLLGLVVHLDTVHLDINAVPGAGNLLGNLLCSVAGLLDNNGPVTGIAVLLNRLLTGLGL